MSITRAQLKHLRELARKKDREEADSFVVDGVRLVREALQSSFSVLEFFYTEEASAHPPVASLVELAHTRTVAVNRISARDMDTVSDTVTAQGVIAVVRQEHPSLQTVVQDASPESVLVALDGVGDPGNLGSIIRTADWFGAQGVLVGRQSVDLYNPKVVRSTMGSLFHLPVVQDVDLLAALSHARESGYTIYGADVDGETHFDRVRFANKAVLVLGNEAWGMSDAVRALTDVRVTIRRYGSAESLNVGVACGILLSGVHRLP
jgi:TrmH family RNA methyltransferase